MVLSFGRATRLRIKPRPAIAFPADRPLSLSLSPPTTFLDSSTEHNIMATQFIMPKAPGPPHSNFHQPQHNQLPPFQSSHYNPSYRSSPQVSPLSTMSTSTGSSPTSPKPRCARQLPPSYIPAVLRPTQHSCKAPYPRPKAEEGAADDEPPPRSSGSFISLPGLAAIGISRLSRRSTGDSGKCIDGSWNLDQFPEVNGLPSRDHWKVCCHYSFARNPHW